MKKIVFALLLSNLVLFVSAQGILGKLNKIANKDSINKTAASIGIPVSGGLSNQDIADGLREALGVGTLNTVAFLGKEDGFLKNDAVKILLPAEVATAEKSFRTIGLGSLVDQTIVSLNRAAEDATSGVGEIFLDAIRKMTIADAVSILKGDDFAATNYLRKTSTPALREKMKPVVSASLKKVNATGYWKDFFTQYNRISAKKVNPDLEEYVLGKAMDGIFLQISQEEKKIRKDPAARTTELLKKVFAN